MQDRLGAGSGELVLRFIEVIQFPFVRLRPALCLIVVHNWLWALRISSIARLSNGVNHLVTPAKARAYRTIDPGLRRDDADRWPPSAMRMCFSMAPRATIFVVEAASERPSDLFAAVAVASQCVAANGGGEVSMSWGFPEASGETAVDSLFTQNGVVYFAATGDTPGHSIPRSSPKSMRAHSRSRGPREGSPTSLPVHAASAPTSRACWRPKALESRLRASWISASVTKFSRVLVGSGFSKSLARRRFRPNEGSRHRGVDERPKHLDCTVLDDDPRRKRWSSIIPDTKAYWWRDRTKFSP
jgi:hypothetical protein